MGNNPILTINPVTVSHSGDYKCRTARRLNLEEEFYSNSVKLRVLKGRPSPVLTVQSRWRQFCTGERVTLLCQFESGAADWSYYWYQDSQETQRYQTEHNRQTGSVLSLSVVTPSHSGLYWCRTGRGNEVYHSQYSNAIQLQVSDPPETRVTLLPPRRQLFTGDNVTLICDVGNYSTGWRYSWYKDSTQSPALHGGDTAGTRYTVHSAALSHSGQYWCRVGREDASFHLNYSQPVSLQVTELFLGVHITAQPSETVWEGETLTLHCAAQLKNSAHKLQYRYVREGRVVKSSWEDTYTIKVRQGDEGKYHCEAEAAGKGIYSTSNDVEITVTERPKPAVTQEPAWERLYFGEPVTLRCGLSVDFPRLEYLWFKDRLGSPVTNTSDRSVDGNILRISSVLRSDRGQYRCLVQRGQPAQSTHPSDPFLLNVSDLFSRVTLLVSPGGSVQEGEPVNLTCDAETSEYVHPLVLYSFFRDGELLSERSGSALYPIDTLNQTLTGSYSCAAETPHGFQKNSTGVTITLAVFP
ncbi:Fc receptor-like protein 5 [Amia ocellicauda]|uniref:Fc receptor-like protein 5 n=1 Tax=Amia ocellicauda TaxID=2972642 RepID=UPI003464656B